MGRALEVISKIEESGLSRIMQHISGHETGAITAYRGKLSKSDNQARNKKLLASLLSKGYGVTSMKGSYIENYGTPDAKEVGEHTYFVVDLKDNGQLEKDLEKLGNEFDQDSVLIIPKGGKGAYLVGTNDADFPGKGKTMKTGDRNLGQEGEFLSRVRGRPFVFKEALKEHQEASGMMGKWAVKLASQA